MANNTAAAVTSAAWSTTTATLISEASSAFLNNSLSNAMPAITEAETMDSLSHQERIRVILPPLLGIVLVFGANWCFYKLALYTKGSAIRPESVERVLYYWVSRFLQFVFSVTVLGTLVHQDDMTQPHCFFGFDRNSHANDHACQSGIALSGITVLWTVMFMIVFFCIAWSCCCTNQTKVKLIPRSFLRADFVGTVCMTVLWLSLAILFGVELQRKLTRCPTCGTSSMYQRGVTIVQFCMIQFVTFAFAIPDAARALRFSLVHPEYQILGGEVDVEQVDVEQDACQSAAESDPDDKVDPWGGRWHQALWRFMEGVLPNLIVRL